LAGVVFSGVGLVAASGDVWRNEAEFLRIPEKDVSNAIDE
jgi:hypothetical protein